MAYESISDAPNWREGFARREAHLNQFQFGPFSSSHPEEPNVVQSSLPAGMKHHGILWHPGDTHQIPANDFSGTTEQQLEPHFTETPLRDAEVPVQDIETPQASVDTRRLNELWHNPQASDPADKIHAVETSDKKYHLLDGNHRVTVARHDNQMFQPIQVAGQFKGTAEYLRERADNAGGDPAMQGSFKWQPRK